MTRTYRVRENEAYREALSRALVAIHLNVVPTDDVMDRLHDELSAVILDHQEPGEHETLWEAAFMYRRLRKRIEATMEEPDRWDGDEDESFHLARYVEWLAAHAPVRISGDVRTETVTAVAAHIERFAAMSLRPETENFREWAEIAEALRAVAGNREE